MELPPWGGTLAPSADISAATRTDPIAATSPPQLCRCHPVGPYAVSSASRQPRSHGSCALQSAASDLAQACDTERWRAVRPVRETGRSRAALQKSLGATKSPTATAGKAKRFPSTQDRVKLAGNRDRRSRTMPALHRVAQSRTARRRASVLGRSNSAGELALPRAECPVSAVFKLSGQRASPQRDCRMEEEISS